MTLSLSIPISPNPVLSELELNKFVAQAEKAGRSPDDLLMEIVVAAIRKESTEELEAAQ